MDIDYGRVVITILNFLILFWFLKKKLFAPVTKFMNDRTNSIQNKLEEARAKFDEATAMKANYEKQLSTADAEGKKIVEEYKLKASKLSDEMLEEAKKEAGLVRERAKIDAEREKEKARDEIRRQIVTLSLLAASKSIGEQLDEEKHHVLIKEFINKAGV